MYMYVRAVIAQRSCDFVPKVRTFRHQINVHTSRQKASCKTLSLPDLTSLSLLFLSLKNIYSWSKSWSGTCRPGFVVAAGLARGNFWEEKKPDQLFPLLAACPGQRPRFCVLFASRSEASASSACILRGTKPPSPFFPAIRDRGCPKAWRRLYSGSLLLLHQLGCRKHIDSKLLFSSACACWFLQELSANSVQGVRVWDFAGQIDGELQQTPPRPLGVRRIPPKGDSVAKTSLLFVAH